MNMKGFTFIEVMAAIAIMGVLIILITPSLINMRKDMLQRTYESRVILIQTAALDYANDHMSEVPVEVNVSNLDASCLNVTIGTLISNGYLAGSDNKKTEMHNPLTNENMNSKVVCVRYTDNNVLERKLIAYIKAV